MKWIKLIAGVLVSAFFAISAISKIQSMDAFEVYVFSSSFLSYDVASIASRLLVAAELFIAICLLFRLKFKLVWWLTMSFLILFSGFLLQQMLGGADENCFCLGELVDFTPGESLIKNAFLFLLLLLIRNSKKLKIRYEKPIFATVLLLSLAAPLILSPPDLLIQGSFNETEHDQEALNAAILSGDIPTDFVKGKTLVAFYSTSCKMCRLASTRIASSIEKENLDQSKVFNVFWGKNPEAISAFYEETFSPQLEYSTLETEPFLEITKGRMPLILLIENGEVKLKMNYRNIEEKEIVGFLEQS